MKQNFMIDVAFTVEGPYPDLEAIPYEVLVSHMAKRLASLIQDKEPDAFGECDSYEVEEVGK